jgi:hypothetical protein
MEDIYSFVYAQERHCITEHRRDACATKAFSNWKLKTENLSLSLPIRPQIGGDHLRILLNGPGRALGDDFFCSRRL